MGVRALEAGRSFGGSPAAVGVVVFVVLHVDLVLGGLGVSFGPGCGLGFGLGFGLIGSRCIDDCSTHRGTVCVSQTGIQVPRAPSQLLARPRRAHTHTPSCSLVWSFFEVEASRAASKTTMPAAPIISCCCRESTETLANGATTTFALDVATGVGLARGAGGWRGLRIGAGRGRAERVVWTLFFGRLATAGVVLLATGGVGRPAVARGACLNGGLREIATAGAGVAFSGAVGVVFSGALMTVT